MPDDIQPLAFSILLTLAVASGLGVTAIAFIRLLKDMVRQRFGLKTPAPPPADSGRYVEPRAY